jgi:5,10-methylene-tetrahydrofolate dehydrogenase/methenyl tetrahydrofolate cyclohydrolase
VDGMNPYNIGTLAMKYHTPYFVSCTPLACQELILSCTSDIMSKKVCIIGRSNIVGMPLNLLLMKYHDASVTVCHSKTSLKEVESSVN